MLYATRVNNSGGFDGNNRYNGPDSPVYGEIPPLPRDGYGVSEDGQPTYSAPTESVPGQPQPPQMPPPMPPQFGPPQQYGPPAPYGAPGAYGPNPYGYAQHPGTNGLAIAALISSLVGGVVACGLGFVAGPILGMIALSQIKKSGEKGRGMAIAGIAVGVIGILVIVAYILILAGLIVEGYSDPYSDTYY